MNDLRTAAQQALEALEYDNPAGRTATITALRAALAQPEHKPMHPEMRKMWEDYFDKCFREHPVQEPVAWIYQNANTDREYLVWRKSEGGRNWRPLYTVPPQRKPLDDLAIADIYTKWDATPGTSMADFARAIERAHGIGGQDD